MVWIQNHWSDITQIIAYAIAIATIIVKATPNLKDDNFFLPVIKFIAKYIALNTNSPTKRPE
jgi:hypothetical protein